MQKKADYAKELRRVVLIKKLNDKSCTFYLTVAVLEIQEILYNV